MITVWIPAGLVSVTVLVGIYAYNTLISLANRVDNAWSQISVQLKRRADLLPNVVDLAKKYAEHEKDVIDAVNEARSQLRQASTPTENADAADNASSSLRKLFAVAEDYPDLQANKNYIQVQEELSSTENKIAYARQHYNDITTAYNTRVESIPFNIVATLFGFEQRELFEPNTEYSGV